MDEGKEGMKKNESGKENKKSVQEQEPKLALENLQKAAYKWYIQVRAEDVPVHGVDIHHAAQKLAVHH